jgi:long-chain-fatty-acid--CoA ligase ACSBG
MQCDVLRAIGASLTLIFFVPTTLTNELCENFADKEDEKPTSADSGDEKVAAEPKEKKEKKSSGRKSTADAAAAKSVPVVPSGEKKKKKKKKSDDGAAAADDDDDDDDDAPAEKTADKGGKAKADTPKADAAKAAPAAAAATAAASSSAPAKLADPDTLIPYPKSASPFWRIESDACVEIRIAKKGVAARPPTTVNELLQLAVSKHGDKPALSWEDNGKWVSMTWIEYSDQIRAAAKSLIHIGMKAHEAVSIIGFNSKEWFIANMGAIAAGGKAAGIYTTNATDACKYIVEHSESRVVVCENAAQLAKFLPIRAELKHVDAYVVWSGALPDGVNGSDKKGGKVYTWADFIKLGADVEDSRLEKRIKAQKPGHCCTLIYTSGTTGNPKAVMITHDNLTWTPQSVFEVLGAEFGAKEEHAISYLPLSHVAAQMLDIHMPIAVTATRGGYATMYFARPDALKGSLKNTLTHVRPTLFFGVPRVWEKFAEAMQAVGQSLPFYAKWVSGFAKGKALEKYEAGQVGHSGSEPSMIATAEKILMKVRVNLGLDRCKFQMTGAAPIAKETLRYFGSVNLPVYELYGMSESTGPQTLSFPGHYLVGSCGPVLPGCGIKIDHVPGRDKAGEGEINFSGR